MKRYIKPTATSIMLQPEGHLASSPGPAIGSDLGDEGDFARRKRRGWDSEEWAAADEER